MAQLARSGSPSLNSLVESVCQSGRNGLDCWDGFVRSVFVYRPEFNEVIRTPEAMLEHLESYGFLEGDCDCVSVFFAAGALALGFPVRFVAIRTEQDSGDYLHVYTEVRYGVTWRRYDATVDRSTVDVEVDYGRMLQDV